MIITIDNYEDYFYRYSEGELTAEERAAVEAFAARHLEQAEELSLYDPGLRLEKSPMAYPDKGSLLRHGTKVMPLWRWVAAACVAAALVVGVSRLWPDGQSVEPKDTMALMHQPTPPKTSVPPAAKQGEEAPAIVSKPDNPQPKPLTAEPAPQEQEEPAGMLPQYSSPVFDEPSLLADAEPSPIPLQEDTTVIEYFDITLFPTTQPSVEVVEVACQPTAINRYRAFRNRVSNAFRDYAYQSYSETRAELLTRIDEGGRYLSRIGE